ncbi:CU044_5270 family protein [Tenggerimyces flavus]|uniref:CU044_5270 family protein n=1 Tax=Tenggerimyces flavus TaxID=1708749 RepID=A0ABV7YNE2_9ACTN|nr:CU044_5270 family protein [Tenggerimyces flavus]MBM7786312.1 hypothetical protein [Tenggerimyces flavus]
MNEEERLLRDVLAQPAAPDPDTVADARAKLDRLTRTEVRRTKSHHLRLAITALVAAAGVIGASLVPQLIPDQDHQPATSPPQSAVTPAGPPSSPTPFPNATEMIGKAATYEAARSKPTGYYWRIRNLTSTTVVTFANRVPYKMELTVVAEHWGGEKGMTAAGLRMLSLRPSSPADSQAHEEAGKPIAVKVQLADAPKPTPLLVVQLPDEGRLVDDPANYLGAADLNGIIVQKLSTQPDKLVDTLLTMRDPKENDDPDSWLFAVLSELLVDTAATPAQRASALKVLADLPGIHYVGRVDDLYGRAGLAIERSGDEQGTQLLLDPKTGGVLGMQRPNGVRVAVLDAGWVTDKPRPPAALDLVPKAE